MEPGCAALGPAAGSPRAPALGELVGGRGGRPLRGTTGAGPEPDAQTRRRRVDPVPEGERWSPDPWGGGAVELAGGVLLPARGDREGSRRDSASSWLGVSCRVPNLTLPLKKIPNLVGMHTLPPLAVLSFAFSLTAFSLSLFSSLSCVTFPCLSPSSCLFAPSPSPRGSSPSLRVSLFSHLRL